MVPFESGPNLIPSIFALLLVASAQERTKYVGKSDESSSTLIDTLLITNPLALRPSSVLSNASFTALSLTASTISLTTAILRLSHLSLILLK